LGVPRLGGCESGCRYYLFYTLFNFSDMEKIHQLRNKLTDFTHTIPALVHIIFMDFDVSPCW